LSDFRPEKREVAAIVLAAGMSQRFGSDKLLHPLTLRGMTLPLAAHSLIPWLDTFAHTTVVVRPGAKVFRSAIEGALGTGKSASIRWIECTDAAQGMAASLICGVRGNFDAFGWLIGLADMPAVPAHAIASVRDALAAGAAIAAPAHAGRRGHPVGFSRHYRVELLALQGDTGGRRLLERDMSEVVEIRVDDIGIFADIDIPGDMQQL